MSAIKYYSLDGDEEVPYEFVVVRNVNGKPEFCASFVNTNCLAYENGVLLKFHERNDELRAENTKLLDEKIDAYNEKVVAQLEADELRAENSKLRKRVAELDELLPENGRWYRAETVEAYVTEIAKLRDLCSELLENLMPELCGKAYWPCPNRDWHKCNDGTCGNKDFVLRAQSLGVDVDGG